MKTTDNEKDTKLKKRLHEKLLYGFLVQLFSHPTDQELRLINKILEEKIKEKFEKKMEGLKDVINTMSESESYELKEDIKKYLIEEYKDNLKKEIIELKKLLKTASSEDEKSLIQEEIDEKEDELKKYSPSFKYNCFYKSCVDHTKELKKYHNEFARDNLYAHFMVEYSGSLVLPDGTFDGINKKIYYYMTKSLNKKCAGLRVDYVIQLKNGLFSWKEEKRKGLGRAAEYVIIFMDEYEHKYYYMYAETLITKFLPKAKSSLYAYINNNDRWIRIPFEFIKKYSYYICDAPSKKAEDDAYIKLKCDCKRPVCINGVWTMYTGTGTEGKPNFDPDKSDMGEFIWTGEHYKEHIKGTEQFLALIYDKNGNKKDGIFDEIYMKSFSELFNFVKKYIGYDKSPKTFTRAKSKGQKDYEKYINKGIEIKVPEKDEYGQFTGKYIDLIVYILPSEGNDIAQDFSKTYLKNEYGQWTMHFEEKLVKKVLSAEKGIHCITKEYYYEKYVNLNSIISSYEKIKAAGGTIPDYKKTEKAVKSAAEITEEILKKFG